MSCSGSQWLLAAQSLAQEVVITIATATMATTMATWRKCGGAGWAEEFDVCLEAMFLGVRVMTTVALIRLFRWYLATWEFQKRPCVLKTNKLQ